MTTTQALTRSSVEVGAGSVRSHQVWADTIQRRDEARTLLDTLLEAKGVSERNMASINRPDMIKQVTGKSSMDAAIDSTKRLIDSFDRVLVDLKSSLSDEDLALLDEVDSAV
ncbi:MAG: hypothetical protein AAGA55_06675 [Planctomycetota bacterium]